MVTAGVREAVVELGTVAPVFDRVLEPSGILKAFLFFADDIFTEQPDNGFVFENLPGVLNECGPDPLDVGRGENSQIGDELVGDLGGVDRLLNGSDLGLESHDLVVLLLNGRASSGEGVLELPAGVRKLALELNGLLLCALGALLHAVPEIVVDVLLGNLQAALEGGADVALRAELVDHQPNRGEGVALLLLGGLQAGSEELDVGDDEFSPDIGSFEALASGGLVTLDDAVCAGLLVAGEVCNAVLVHVVSPFLAVPICRCYNWH